MSYKNTAFIADEPQIDRMIAATADKNGQLNDIECAATLDANEKVEKTEANGSDESLDTSAGPERENWGKGIEFLMSCIAMSVGLGNVWRFPFTALDNGGV